MLKTLKLFVYISKCTIRIKYNCYLLFTTRHIVIYMYTYTHYGIQNRVNAILNNSMNTKDIKTLIIILINFDILEIITNQSHSNEQVIARQWARQGDQTMGRELKDIVKVTMRREVVTMRREVR